MSSSITSYVKPTCFPQLKVFPHQVSIDVCMCVCVCICVCVCVCVVVVVVVAATKACVWTDAGSHLSPLFEKAIREGHVHGDIANQYRPGSRRKNNGNSMKGGWMSRGPFEWSYCRHTQKVLCLDSCMCVCVYESVNLVAKKTIFLL